MNETRTHGGPNLGLLLLIPAAVIIAKGAMRRRAMMEAGWGPSGRDRRYGQHRFAGADGEIGPRAFNPPPWIESALDAWHTRAHRAPEITTPEPAPEAGTTTA